ncbi:MAG: hypothetical protein JKX68_08830, partial [Flavobacteriales bacterium]|nr:hypothetical protein [Flavobacteriales bacterium]
MDDKEIAKFLEKFPRNKRLGSISSELLSSLESQVSEELYEFLKNEHRTVYGDNFFWTVNPEDYSEVLNYWGIKGKNCYVLMRSSFGSLVYVDMDAEETICLNVHNGTYGILSGSKGIWFMMNLIL